MASSWADQGLQNAWFSALNPNGVSYTEWYANLITATFTPGPTLTFAGLTWATAGTYQKTNINNGWTFSVNTTTHICTATQQFTWTFGSGAAGLVCYGLGYYYYTGSAISCITQRRSRLLTLSHREGAP